MAGFERRDIQGLGCPVSDTNPFVYTAVKDDESRVRFDSSGPRLHLGFSSSQININHKTCVLNVLVDIDSAVSSSVGLSLNGNMAGFLLYECYPCLFSSRGRNGSKIIRSRVPRASTSVFRHFIGRYMLDSFGPGCFPEKEAARYSLHDQFSLRSF